MSLGRMSLDQMQLLAYAAGFGAVHEDTINIERDVPPDDANFVPGWHMPDAPAPRTAVMTRDTSRAVTIVEPLWAKPIVPPANTWAQHLVAVARSMSAYIPGRGAPA